MVRRSAVALSVAVATLPALVAGFAGPTSVVPAPRRRDRRSPRTRTGPPALVAETAARGDVATDGGPATTDRDTARRALYAGPADRELPKVLGGLKIGTRELAVVTGASSGLGLNAAAALAKSNEYFVVMAVRDVEKGKRAAKQLDFPEGSYVVMKLELGSLRSVRDFVANLKAFKSARPLNHLVCNAAVYKPADPAPAWTDDGFEMTMGVNHLGHFLLCNLLIEDMARAKNARLVVVGSVTGNTNTIGGGLVYPRADLGTLGGFAEGGTNPVAMADGAPFFGAKAYKDSKVCNMMTLSELHSRYHDETGIVFSSLYPGCIAETALFREKRPWFRQAFPWFMKYVTKAYVSEEEAGERVAQVISDDRTGVSGKYWSWSGAEGSGGAGGAIYENEQSEAVRDTATSTKLWELSKTMVGLAERDMYKKGKMENFL